MASAEDLGKKLLAEVQEVGLDELLNLLRHQDEDDHPEKDVLGFRPLDQLLQELREARSGIPRTASTPPIVELLSLHPGGGSAHILSHLCALSVLPTEHGGQQSCVVIFDVDGTFSVERLATEIQSSLRRSSDVAASVSIDDAVFTALKHIHIFRPQTLAATTATLASLPDYLFNGDRHHSFDRQVGFIALDSASAFYWQNRAEMEDAAFHASTDGSGIKAPAPSSGYATLATALKAASKTFNCPVVFTSQHLGSVSAQQQHRSYRSPFPTALATLPTLRLVLQRVPVRKFPANISLEAALREVPDRQKAVDEGKFVCFVNEWGLDERAMQRLNAGPGRGGFSFRVGTDGMVVEEV